MNGPGKYDDCCTLVRKLTDAEGAIVAIFGGKDGSGFSVQMPERAQEDVPKILRNIANAIDRDLLIKPEQERTKTDEKESK